MKNPSSTVSDARALVAELAQVPSLDGVPEPCLAALAELAVPRAFAKGEAILDEGEPASSFFIVRTGHLKRSRELPNGRKVILAVFAPGDLFGAVAALGAQACDASVVAIEASRCLEVPREALFARFARQPELIGQFLPMLTRRLVECKNCVVELSCYRVETRLAHLFLKLARTLGEDLPEGTFLPLSLTRQELADMIGTTVESSIRVMSRWGKDRLVESRKDGFVVPDLGALEELAGAGS